jgi:flagellar motor protein MotB
MNKLESLVNEDEGFFGPGTDLAISLVAVLLLMIAIRSSLDEKNRRGQLEIEATLRNQMHLVDALAARYGTQREEIGPDLYGISIRKDSAASGPDIRIQNDATLQRISFSSNVLFQPDEVELSPQGQAVLRIMGEVLRSHIEQIQEIQIQGHADPAPSRRYSSNLELAAYRGMTVFRTLQGAGIDPRSSMMSATTFGEYVPVQRRISGDSYSPQQLLYDNNSVEKRELNRRIEVLLIYRRQPVSQGRTKLALR